MDMLTRSLLNQLNPTLGDRKATARHAQDRLPDAVLPRSAAASLREALQDTAKAHLVVGPRQAGKSTLIWSLVAESPRDLLYLNCEEPLVRELCRSPTAFLHEIDEWLPKGGWLFLEEAQWLEDAGLFLKGLVDGRLRRTVLATGSASLHLLARTPESLAGRATRHTVWPFSLSEVLPPPSKRPAAARRRDARKAVERQLLFGSYPEAWVADDARPVLEELVRAFVLRDASDRFRIGRPDAFRLVMRLAAGQVGDLVNVSEWSRAAGIAVSTVSDYVALLEETHVLSLVRPYLGGKRAELTQAPKAYFVDNGLRNAVSGGFASWDERADQGKLLENWVFSELHKARPEPGAVRYWRTKGGAEVDFIVEKRDGSMLPVDVKATKPQRPSRSMRAFIEAYAPDVFLGVHLGEPDVERVGTTEVRWVPAEDLPEALAAAT